MSWEGEELPEEDREDFEGALAVGNQVVEGKNERGVFSGGDHVEPPEVSLDIEHARVEGGNENFFPGGLTFDEVDGEGERRAHAGEIKRRLSVRRAQRQSKTFQPVDHGANGPQKLALGVGQVHSGYNDDVAVLVLARVGGIPTVKESQVVVSSSCAGRLRRRLEATACHSHVQEKLE
jgi:hypothetical protein